MFYLITEKAVGSDGKIVDVKILIIRADDSGKNGFDFIHKKNSTETLEPNE